MVGDWPKAGSGKKHRDRTRRRLRAVAPVKPLASPKRDDMLDDPNRPPLPAGHPLTWGLLTDEPFPEGDDA
jgi:hypothetical protein